MGDKADSCGSAFDGVDKPIDLQWLAHNLEDTEVLRIVTLVGADDDHGYSSQVQDLSRALQELEAVDAGHHEIQQNDVRLGSGHQHLERHLPVDRWNDSVALVPQHDVHGVADVSVILNEQDRGSASAHQ